MTDEALIRRLRDFAERKTIEDPYELCRRAADALEESNEVMQGVLEGARRLIQHGAKRKK